MEYDEREEGGIMMISRFEQQFLKIFIASFVTFATGHYARAAQQVGYKPAIAHLSGIIVVQQFYGPPNFGENPKTDAKENVLEIKLDAPINVIAHPDMKSHLHAPHNSRAYIDSFIDADSYYNVRRMELVDLNYPAEHLDNFVGEHVAITGRLYERQDGMQFTNVLVIVDHISIAGNKT